jgi:flavin reductase (DIM6/NTAB) family NADH-FMN oxidoreductase RutF
MILDPATMSRGDVYRFMTRAVVPRPIAFVSTVNGQGLSNVAPFSYFIALTAQPPLFGISIAARSGDPKDTLRNIQDTEEFVINMVSESMAERMVQSSGDWPEDVSEFTVTGLTELPSDLVRAPRVGESPLSMECRLHRIVDLGASRFVVGEMLRAHVKDEVLTDGKVDVEKLRPVARLGGDEYAIIRSVVHMARPAVASRGKRRS